MVTFTHLDAGTPEDRWVAAGVASLPPLPAEAIPGAGGTLVVVAAHPDDESLGAAGLMNAALRAGADVYVVLCTAGEASHPDSPTHTQERLADVRTGEFAAAMDALRSSVAGAPAGSLTWDCLGLPDGRVAENVAAVEAAVAARLPKGSAATIAAPYRFDGHTDHDAVGAAASRVAARHKAALVEFPIWYWLWADPEASPEWTHWRSLALDGGALAAKRAAMDSHTSQITALSDAPGDGVLLAGGFLAHFERGAETFRWSPSGRRDSASAAAVFDALYTRDPDPWAYLTSDYERRKRAVTLASLPRTDYASALEAGCSIGVLTQALAERCGSVIALDASEVAIAAARKRLKDLRQVDLVRADLPGGWPDVPPGSLELVVVSEVGYFLGRDELTLLLARASESLAPGGHLLLCHWLHPIEGWELDGETVHSTALDQLGWDAVVVHREADFLLEVFEAPGGGA